MKCLNTLVLIAFIGGGGNLAVAQSIGEYLEPTPEELDAAFSAEDAAREAALWSDKVIDRTQVDPLGSLVGKADLIIRGSVVSQNYSYDDVGVPFTHTTIAVTDILRGDYSGEQFTIVQEGGPSRDNDRRAMMVSSSKHFNIGEEELLFLALQSGEANTTSREGRPGTDPIYTGPDTVNVLNRFRIHEGRVYNEDGYGVIVDAVTGGDGHRLRHSHDRNPALRFSEIHIGNITLQKHFSNDAGSATDAPDFGVARTGTVQSVAPGFAAATAVEEFSTAISK